MKITKSLFSFPVICGMSLCILALLTAVSGDAAEEALFTISVKPNVLLILDNSNSMDQDFIGNGICSWATGSRSVEGKNALAGIVNAYIEKMRLGLMTYKLPSATKYNLHGAVYFCSYVPKSYCPDPPPE